MFIPCHVKAFDCDCQKCRVMVLIFAFAFLSRSKRLIAKGVTAGWPFDMVRELVGDRNFCEYAAFERN